MHHSYKYLSTASTAYITTTIIITTNIISELLLLYYCNPSPSIQLFSIITHVCQVVKTWKYYVK